MIKTIKKKIKKSSYREASHESEKIIFRNYPFIGSYFRVKNEIDKSGMQKPTSAQNASIIYGSFMEKKDGHTFVESFNHPWPRVVGHCLWEFTENFYLPKSNKEINNGVILYDGEVKGYSNDEKEKFLVKKLIENDPNARFVPFGFKQWEQTLDEFVKNPYIIARYGREGAEKLAEISSYSFGNKAEVWTSLPDSIKINSYEMPYLMTAENGFRVCAYDWYNGPIEFAYGILKKE